MMKPLAVIVVRRQLGALQTGANVYLSVLLHELRAAGFAIHLVFAPESSFGSLPVATVGRPFQALSNSLSWPKTLRVGRYFISLAPSAYVRFFRRALSELACRLLGRKMPTRLGRVSKPLDEAEMAATAEVVTSLVPDLVIVEYSALGPVLEKVTSPGVTKGILLHDLFSVRAQAMRNLQRPVDFAELTLEEEAALCRSADLLIYASQSEREAFELFLPDRTHIWLAPHCSSHEPIPPSGRPKALFLGVRHSGNLDALEFLMEEIWPQVITRKADAELWIVGEIGMFLRPEWRRLPGVTVLGIVEDLKPLGGPDTIGLAPTRVASGISIKLADYMQLDMAVLASKVALEGYGHSLNGLAETAESAQGFADRLADLLELEDQRHALARRIRKATSSCLLGSDDLHAQLNNIAAASPYARTPSGQD